MMIYSALNLHTSSCHVKKSSIVPDRIFQKILEDHGFEMTPRKEGCGVLVVDNDLTRSQAVVQNDRVDMEDTKHVPSAKSLLTVSEDSVTSLNHNSVDSADQNGTQATSWKPAGSTEHLNGRHPRIYTRPSLVSPTRPLDQRLNSPSFISDHEANNRNPILSRPTNGYCILPGPGSNVKAFASDSVQARTMCGDRPAWWCKIDKLVVFDGIKNEKDGHMTFLTRTSKGLSAARQSGYLETVIIPVGCAHCQDMLNRREWRYDARVCARNVCGYCKERCRRACETEKAEKTENVPRKREADCKDANRSRADSVLQDDSIRGEEGCT